jgi:hypothetical protein
MLYYKSFASTMKKVTPTAADLDLIGNIALEEVGAEALYVGRMTLCNDQYDRSFERFPKEYLKRFADTLPGKSVMQGHDYHTLPVGRFYDAEIRQKSGVLELVPSYYMLADDPLVPKIKAGVVKGVSIGFEPDLRLCDLCQKDYDGWWNDPEDEDPCEHLRGREYEINGTKVRCTLTYGGNVEKVEAVEGSFVWLGCQYGAETTAKEFDLTIRAKMNHFEGQQQRRYVPAGHNSTSDRRWSLPVKENAMQGKDEKENGGAPDPAQEALVKAGERYKERILESIRTRYAACNMEATGVSIARSMERVTDIDDLEKAQEDARVLFESHHQPHGTVPDAESRGDQQATGKLSLSKSPMGGWNEEDYL